MLFKNNYFLSYFALLYTSLPQACACEGCSGGNTEGNTFNYNTVTKVCYIRNCKDPPIINYEHGHHFDLYFKEGYDTSSPVYN